MIKDTVGEKDQSLTDIIITNPSWKMLMYFSFVPLPFASHLCLSIPTSVSQRMEKAKEKRRRKK